ncbi:MAG: major facilitator superfamily transporter [Chloroflexi bacterium]|nr:major facilitator superfamily transporter [Chloroflexota bacterium]
MRLFRWTVAPYDATPVQKNNFLNVQIDAIGVGLANAASPFLPVFLTRLGATNLQIGLLTAMPGVAGLLLAIFVGRFLQRQRKIVPWFSTSRLLYLSAFAATGLAAFVVPEEQLVTVILIIWAAATLPQIALAVSFSVVMNAVAGPALRYDLMARRWSILGVTTALTVTAAGQFLERLDFPINFQLLFIGLSLGGLISFIFSSRINLPESEPPAEALSRSLRERVSGYFGLIWSNQEFVRFSTKRVVYLFGTLLATPLFPLYYVREVQATDAWIGYINTAQTLVLLVGYSLWTNQSRRRGSRFVLMTTTFGLSLYPALIALTDNLVVIVVIAGLAGIFQAGIDLVFFDELMKTVPVEYSATFVSMAQSTQYASAVFAPLVGTWLAGHIGISGALLVAAGVRFIGFLLFTFWNPVNKPVNPSP